MVIVIGLIVTVFVLTVLKIFSHEVEHDPEGEDTRNEECDKYVGS